MPRTPPLTDVLSDSNDRNLQTLRASMEMPEPFVKAVYEHYRRISLQGHEEQYSYVYSYSALAYLQSIGLLLLLSAEVSKTHTNRIQVFFDSELLKAIWSARFSS